MVMINGVANTDEPLQIAQRWCDQKGPGWSVLGRLGRGSTAPVYAIDSPDGPKALKVYDVEFSRGDSGQIEQRRIDQLLALEGHECPFLVQVFEGGRFSERLFLLMSRAPGAELATRLPEIPRSKIREIVDQVARAAMFLESKNLCHRDIKASNIFISGDFTHCTLLDMSVIRNVYDPIGVGTDHDGQLPIVATARYSPPEYLFRLIEPGPDLWHALNVYQLGALLHDLIMREPLFQAEYLTSNANRYRFAWIIAMEDPIVNADDVDQDLVLLARRALDKNWKRRSVLSLGDFLADSNVQQLHALQYLGLSLEHGTTTDTDFVATRFRRVRELAMSIDEGLVQYLKAKSVTAKHEDFPGAHDSSRLLVFTWDGLSSANGVAQPRQIELRSNLQLLPRSAGEFFAVSIELVIKLDGETQAVAMELPDVLDQPGIESSIVAAIVSAFETLAQSIIRRSVVGTEQ